MDLTQLRYFVAAAETGAISRAAARCGVAQPSLSQQLRKFELSLGHRLFDRLGRGVALTDAGRALLPRARRILAEVQEAEARLAGDVAEGAGRLAIGAIPTMAPYLLPPVLDALRRELPRCELVVSEDLTANLVEQLVDNHLDAAVTSTPIEHPRLNVEVLGREPLLVVVPAGHALASDEDDAGVSLPRLRREPTIALSQTHCLGKQIGEFCAARGLGATVTCRATQLSTVLALVDRGMGVSLVPRMAAEHDRGRRPKRRYLPLKSHTPTREIALVRRRERTRPRAVKRLAQLLAQRLAEAR